MIEFPCWGCGKTLKAKEEHAGKQCKCTKCERVNQIPELSPPEPENPLVMKYEPPPVQGVPEVVAPILQAPFQPKPVVIVKKEPAKTPTYVLIFAGIGMLCTALYLLGVFPSSSKPKPAPDNQSKVPTHREMLEMTDDDLQTYFMSLKLADLEELASLFSEYDARGTTNIIRKQTIYSKMLFIIQARKESGRNFPGDK